MWILRLRQRIDRILEHFGRIRRNDIRIRGINDFDIFQLGFAFQHYTIITIGVITNDHGGRINTTGSRDRQRIHVDHHATIKAVRSLPGFCPVV